MLLGKVSCKYQLGQVGLLFYLCLIILKWMSDLVFSAREHVSFFIAVTKYLNEQLKEGLILFQFQQPCQWVVGWVHCLGSEVKQLGEEGLIEQNYSPEENKDRREV